MATLVQAALASSSDDDKKTPFTDLTEFVDPVELQALDDYLMSHIDFSDGKPNLKDGKMALFVAEGRKYSDALELSDRDTSVWCQDTFVAYSSYDDFVQDRAHRGDPKTWRPNHNGRVLLPGVLEFCQRLPMLSRLGKITIIANHPGFKGIEHVDHRIDELVSEFVWIRTASSRKVLRPPAARQ